MCKVSICIPAYNSVSSIKRLINSIVIQTYKDYEIIITDDSRHDDIQKYVISLGHEAIHYYKNTRQLGASDNCNKAISRATGKYIKYIKIMHHDDWFTDSDSLEKFVKMLEENANADIAFSGTNQVCSDGQTSRCIADTNLKALTRNYRTLYAGNWIGAPSATIIRNKDFLMDSNLIWLGDMELYIRILRQNPKFVYTKAPLISIGISATQLTNSCKNNWSLQRYEYTYVLKKLKLYKHVDCIYVYLIQYARHIWRTAIRKKN